MSEHPKPRLYQITIEGKHKKCTKKHLQVLLLAADKADLSNAIETYAEDFIPGEYEVLFVEIQISFSGFMHDAFLEGYKNIENEAEY